jgi:hypothetical protein
MWCSMYSRFQRGRFDGKCIGNISLSQASALDMIRSCGHHTSPRKELNTIQ